MASTRSRASTLSAGTGDDGSRPARPHALLPPLPCRCPWSPHRGPLPPGDSDRAPLQGCWPGDTDCPQRGGCHRRAHSRTRSPPRRCPPRWSGARERNVRGAGGAAFSRGGFGSESSLRALPDRLSLAPGACPSQILGASQLEASRRRSSGSSRSRACVRLARQRPEGGHASGLWGPARALPTGSRGHLAPAGRPQGPLLGGS